MMLKRLLVPVLALTLSALGACSSSSNNNGGTGGKGAGTGGADAGTGGAGTGGADAGTGGAGTGGAGTGGATTDASDTAADMSTDTGADMSTDTGSDTGGDAASANFCAAYNMATANSMLPGISVTDFCTKYNAECTFGGSMHYTDLGDCMSKYTAAAAGVQSCRAAHLCNAVVTNGGSTSMHCQHAAGFTLCTN